MMHAVTGLFVNLRALVDTRIVQRVSYHPTLHPLRQLLLEPLVDALLHVDAARGDAGFSLPTPNSASDQLLKLAGHVWLYWSAAYWK
jgi:hypothetical protein